MTGPHVSLLADRYELSSLIAGGGMGQVWRGRDTLLDRPVAVKVLRDQFSGDPAFLTRFRAEAQHAAVLTHPHIAAVFDYGEVPGAAGLPPVAYLVMELVEGESLADVLRREGRLDVPRTLDVLQQAADGLGAAHAAGVVHRDIKPANLLVGRDGRVKLTDFGIARSAASVALTATGQVIGTAHYLSPEQASGQPASPASDVYALGTVGYECLAGRRAFEGESAVQIAVMQIREHPDSLPTEIPAAVRALVERAMAKNPAARFPDGSALRDGVDAVLAGAPLAVQAPTAILPSVPGAVRPVGVPAGGSHRRRWPIAVLVAALLLVAGIGVAVTAFRGDPMSEAEAGSKAVTEAGSEAGAGAVAAASTPAGVDVVAENLLGRPVRDVQAELIGRGLRVGLVPIDTVEVPAGQVAAVDPTGTLPPDALVTLTYAVPPVPEPAPVPVPMPAPVVEGGGNQGSGNQGNGNQGKGNGHGNQDKDNGNQDHGSQGNRGDDGDEGDEGDEDDDD